MRVAFIALAVAAVETALYAAFGALLEWLSFADYATGILLAAFVHAAVRSRLRLMKGDE